MVGQLSQAFTTPSPSKSSQASPTPSPFPSSCSGLKTLGQLSSESIQPSGWGLAGVSQLMSPSLVLATQATRMNSISTLSPSDFFDQALSMGEKLNLLKLPPVKSMLPANGVVYVCHWPSGMRAAGFEG